MANITLFTPTATRANITVVPNPALLAYLASKGYTVTASRPL